MIHHPSVHRGKEQEREQRCSCHVHERRESCVLFQMESKGSKERVIVFVEARVLLAYQITVRISINSVLFHTKNAHISTLDLNPN